MQKYSDISRHITDVLSTPAVLKGVLEKWPSRKWSPEYLASLLEEKRVKIRIGPVSLIKLRSVLWEGDCAYEKATLSQFCEWLSSNHTTKFNPTCSSVPQQNNPLMKYDRGDHWCYVDYKQMAFLFEDHPEILKAVQWSDLGFDDRDGEQSTIWIGSEGAFTPGHYDTYGFNLVAQIYGRKRWHLFPPDQTDLLYPTRLPYEESSVFSPINISNPDLELYPKFAETTPYIVTLEPGEVLFVPKHWWHFVESLETSISINTWVDVESDKESSVQEAVTRVLVSSLMADETPPSKWLCPTETFCDEETNYNYMNASLKDFHKSLQHLHTPRTSELRESQAEFHEKGAPHLQNLSSSQTAENNRMPTSDLKREDGMLSSEPLCRGSFFAETDKVLPTSTDDKVGTHGYGEQQSVKVGTHERNECLCADRQTKRHKNDDSVGVNKLEIPPKLSKIDQNPIHSTGMSNLVIPVKCCGTIYKNDQLGIDSRATKSTREGEFMNMQMRSKGRTDLHTDDLRQMLVQCVTHPDVVSLIATKLQETFYEKV